MGKKEDSFYKRLKLQLEDKHQFPCLYLFKFIVPSSNKNVALIEAFFDKEAQITTKESSSKKYTSISIKTVMLSSIEIITIYKKAHCIEGVISL